LVKSKDDMMRDFILDRSEALFTASGYKNTSMDRIAETCEISKPTLYNYFKSKNSLFLGIFARFQNDIREKIKELMGQSKDKYQTIDDIIDLSLTKMQEKQGFLKMMILEYHLVIQECENIEEQMQMRLQIREEVSQRLGEFMKDVVRPEIIEEFGVLMVGLALSNLLEGTVWDSLKSNSTDNEKQKKLIMKLLRKGILV
jgi:AcrR family transcriptional regulator